MALKWAVPPKESAFGTHYIEAWLSQRTSLDITDDRKHSCCQESPKLQLTGGLIFIHTTILALSGAELFFSQVNGAI
jgi:hypothetical protein